MTFLIASLFFEIAYYGDRLIEADSKLGVLNTRTEAASVLLDVARSNRRSAVLALCSILLVARHDVADIVVIIALIISTFRNNTGRIGNALRLSKEGLVLGSELDKGGQLLVVRTCIG
mgnify:CR=1 FL=1